MKNERQNEVVITQLIIREGDNCTLVAVPLGEATTLMRILPDALRCKIDRGDSFTEYNIFILKLGCGLQEYFEVFDDFVPSMVNKHHLSSVEPVEFYCTSDEFKRHFDVA